MDPLSQHQRTVQETQDALHRGPAGRYRGTAGSRAPFVVVVLVILVVAVAVGLIGFTMLTMLGAVPGART